MNYRKIIIAETDIEGVSVELGSIPSCVMDYTEFVVRKNAGLVAIGYLVDDHDAQNPLENCDGMGHVHSAHRHAGKDAHQAMQSALGMDGDWQPNTSLDVVERIASSSLMELVRTEFKADVVQHVLECANNENLRQESAIQAFQDDFCGSRPWGSMKYPLVAKVEQVKTWDTFLEEAWEQATKAGLIGDPYTVVLDCYDHGGQHWSVSGSGMQCAFDTASGAGVWVPDVYLRKDLDAIKTQDGMEAARHKAVEFARQALESFNAWLSGDCYGIAVNVFVQEDERMVRLDDSAVHGYIGRSWAEEALVCEVESLLAHHSAKAA